MKLRKDKTKSAVKSETGQKIVKALKEDKSVMKEFTKAKKQLDDYTSGVRKSKPAKAMLDILEKQGVISKIEDEFKGAGNASGKISRIKKAKKWTGFADDTLRKGIDTAAYGYKEYKKATNPITAKLHLCSVVLLNVLLQIGFCMSNLIHKNIVYHINKH